ncbi:MAG: MmcQ/YjbR family DNA-binding protein [Oscillospiraceae bacterium]|nr:MmcQ/YjbR family DNA-binding protein [Oscillospiraceae bacterium]
MNRAEYTAWLKNTYSAEGERLFSRYPDFLVFRHGGNRKWFAVIMDLPHKNLGLDGAGKISVVNLKCDPRLIASFREEAGIYPGWHMNKAHWLSVSLEGGVKEDLLRFLTDMSYERTKK